MSGDFRNFNAYIGDWIKSYCSAVGFKKASQICDPFLTEAYKFKFWVGCRLDGEEESGDAKCLQRIKQAFTDLQSELAKMEQCMQDFYYEIQDPRFD